MSNDAEYIKNQHSNRWLILLCMVIFIVAFFGFSGAFNNKELISDDLTQQIIDISDMSSTAVYAEIVNIKSNPSNYLGKTLIVKGIYSSTYDKITDIFHNYLIFYDSMGCCYQSLEFVCVETNNDKLPKEGEKVQLQGLLDSYKLGESTYYALFITYR